MSENHLPLGGVATTNGTTPAMVRTSTRTSRARDLGR